MSYEAIKQCVGLMIYNLAVKLPRKQTQKCTTHPNLSDKLLPNDDDG